MAFDKVIDSTQLNSDLGDIANAIRAKSGGSSALAFPAGFVSEIQAISSGSGLTDDIKQALLQIAQKVAYIDDQGQTYYQDLYNALYPPADLMSITAVYTQSGTVYPTTPLDDLKDDLVVTGTYDDQSTAVIPASGYTLNGTLTAGTSTITVTSGGKTTTFSVTVTAAPTLSSISAVYTQSGTVYDTDTLDSLKGDLVVTAHYSDSSTATVAAEDYTLSGDLTHEQVIIDLLDGATWTDGIAFDDNGNELDRPTLACSDFLPVTTGTTYTYRKPVSGGTDAYGMGLYLYDSNKGWISRETSAGTQSGTDYVKVYTPASNVAYVRLMAYVTAKSGAEFTYDATPSSWTSTITASYGGKTDTFSVTVTHRELMFVGASYGAGTTGGTVTFNQDGTVRLVSTGDSSTWGLCFSPYGSASAFKTWGDLKGHTVRLAYKITWAGKNSTTRLTAAGHLCSDLSRYDATRLRYSSFFDTNREADASMLENKEGYVDLLIPSAASGWESGSSAVSDSNYFSFRTYLVTSAAGADVTLDFKFYDMGVLS